MLGFLIHPGISCKCRIVYSVVEVVYLSGVRSYEQVVILKGEE